MTNKLTSEEKDFNRAMCTTCLLDWPMAQCLSCKFYAVEHEVEFDPNTMEMNMDYRTTTKVLQAVEQATLEQMVAENPDNTYWEKRLADFLANYNPADVAQRIEQEIDSQIDSVKSDGRNEIEHAQITATFGKVKVTTSAEWRKRHLHQTAEQVEAAKVQAEVLKGLR